jgi:hypothetical protein
VAWATPPTASDETEGREEGPDPAPQNSLDRTDVARCDPALSRARKRNLIRIRHANEADEAIISKYLPSEASAFFSVRMVGPDDAFQAPDSWLEEIREVISTEPPLPRKPDFHFSTDPSAVEANGALLESFGFDFEKLLESQRGTTAWHGSEFREIPQLQRIIGRHPIFAYLAGIFAEGMDYIFRRELTSREMKREAEHMIGRGNHKSATAAEEVVKRLLLKDVTHGFSLPFPASQIPKIPNSAVQPCGLAAQFSLQADGSRVVKQRLTHDLSYAITGEGISVNDRIDMSRYPEMYYGWCLIRLVHFIACLRFDYPGKRILVAKYDYSDAYRRMSQTWRAAIQSIIVLGGIAYMALRLAFGGSPNPACFCAFSEALTDFANELSCSTFEPRFLSSPIITELITKPVGSYSEDEPFATSIAPAVEVPTTLASRKDCFIDDIISVFLESEENLRREPHAVPLAVHALSRPHRGDNVEPVPRRPLLAPDKLAAEGTPREVQIVLGWTIDTRRMLVLLPRDKYLAWVGDLDETIGAGKATIGELQTLIGRLNHASFLVPLSRHFLNGLRDRIGPNSQSKRRTVRFNLDNLEDLRLWRLFLGTAHSGISMNLLTLRLPSRIGWSDSCPFGLGGYTQMGWAWRLRIPPWSAIFGNDTANNALEFLGMAITIKLLIIEAAEEQYPCLLPLGDNTSAIAWIFKSSKLKRGTVYYTTVREIAREIARDISNAGCQVTPQHLRGTLNDVSDLLSFAGTVRGKTNPLTIDNPSDDILTQRIHAYLPQIIPESFRISPLPDEVVSFALRVLGMLDESLTRNRKRPTLALNERGGGGRHSLGTSGWTPSSVLYPATSGTSSAEHFSLSTEMPISTSRAELLGDVRNRWWSRLCETPSALWQRRFGQMTGTAPSTTRWGPPVASPFVPASRDS